MTEQDDYKEECLECGGDGSWYEEDRRSSDGVRKVICEACHDEDDDPEDDE